MKERSPKPESLAKQISGDRSQGKSADGPPFEWPDRCGTFDIRIDRDGVWYYRGSPIRRLALCRLFSTVLRRDADGAYWLVTPVEAGRIEVEDVPFTAVEIRSTGSGPDREITLRTNLDDIVTVDFEHPIRVDCAPGSDEPRPYVTVRDGLEARLLRPVFYELVDLGEPARRDGETILGVWSGGTFFRLGAIPEVA